tara:strand:+ start:571 stop:981 length:411 start_codon:yes stop_codon:yes gene_type:complete
MLLPPEVKARLASTKAKDYRTAYATQVARLKPGKIVNKLTPHDYVELFEVMRLVIKHEPGIRKAIYLQQFIHAPPENIRIDRKSGFFYNVNPKKGVCIQKIIASDRPRILEELMDSLLTECNRVYLMYCKTVLYNQ